MQITITTERKRQVLDITHEVNLELAKTGIMAGSVILTILHTTAALATADLDPGTDLDLLDALEAMTPQLAYRHPHDPSHAPDHILATIVGSSLALVVDGGEVKLGPWQRIIVLEFDGPRQRNIALAAHSLA